MNLHSYYRLKEATPGALPPDVSTPAGWFASAAVSVPPAATKAGPDETRIEFLRRVLGVEKADALIVGLSGHGVTARGLFGDHPGLDQVLAAHQPDAGGKSARVGYKA